MANLRFVYPNDPKNNPMPVIENKINNILADFINEINEENGYIEISYGENVGIRWKVKNISKNLEDRLPKL